MKLVLSLFAFVLTLTLAHRTLAAAESHSAEGNSVEAKMEAKEAKTVEEMRSLFPPKKPELGKGTEPAKTTLEAPAYFAKIDGNEVTLKWKAVDGADQYHLQVATDPNFKWLVTNEYFLTNTTYQQKDLKPGLHYFWRVNAVAKDNAPTHRKSGFAMSMFATSGTATETK